MWSRGEAANTPSSLPASGWILCLSASFLTPTHSHYLPSNQVFCTEWKLNSIGPIFSAYHLQNAVWATESFFMIWPQALWPPTLSSLFCTFWDSAGPHWAREKASERNGLWVWRDSSVGSVLVTHEKWPDSKHQCKKAKHDGTHHAWAEGVKTGGSLKLTGEFLPQK